MEIAWNAPRSLPVQPSRPNTWLNCDAARVLDMLKGSYLLNGEYRNIQDPESLRASSIRQGSAWQAWLVLRDSVLIQINTSDQNPAVVVGLKQEDSWELSPPFVERCAATLKGYSAYVTIAHIQL